ncbi:flagellar export protein FliJ [Roseateles saccharophilus]|uniref:Flagellar FliJ protein n=1 Tax=Roseateles saccharophilus TaxID=304 RepID=A0A4V2VRK1_ROSSA|nr:flagellar export protein FliJ [Roseateles saccharophilus]MDG0833769.1 flagellar export protein FliJ [Roseateles saccharophilus]TCU98849.1 flagellar FliJ protein [Roseateles saccharophilus]
MSATTLSLLLERAEAERDAAAQALHAANAQAQAARAQHGELSGYRQEYQQRWTEQFSRATTMDIVACYQSFGQRLNQAVDTQGHVAQHADQREVRARDTLRAAEMRVAALRQLIKRREAEARAAADRHEQRTADEFAARVHLRRSLQAHA